MTKLWSRYFAIIIEVKDAKKPQSDKRQRILFFDILRILAVALLLVHHTPMISAGVDSPFLAIEPLFRFIYDNGKFLTYYVTSGPIGVYLLVFISGAVLYSSYSHKRVEYWPFLWGRFRRLYPAYWLSLGLCLAISPMFILQGDYIIAQLSGFLPSASYFQWWIGLFMSLYIVFPFLLKAVRRYPNTTLAVSLIVTLIFRLITPSESMSFLGFPGGASLLDRVIFPCFIFEFTLGMYIVQKKLYPKKMYSNAFLFFMADVSYFVFLTHQFVRAYLGEHNPNTFWMASSYVPYLCTVIVVATIFMYSDRFMQKGITVSEKYTKRWWNKYKQKVAAG